METTKKNRMASTVLITGANGFIGSYTTQLFESLGLRVVPLDVVPRSGDLSLLPIKGSTILMDVTDSAAFREVCKKEKVTHIFHAAHPPRKEDPAVLEFCLQAMRNILETAKEMSIRRVVFSSSGAIYGPLRKKDHSLIKEDDPVTIYPTFLYRSVKMLGEWLGDFYSRQHGVSFISLRYSAVYGPGEAKGIGLALKQGIMEGKCRPYLTRVPDDLIFVKDIARAVYLACFCEQPKSRAYNIASDRSYGEKDLELAIRRHLPEISFEIGKHPDAGTTNIYRQRDLLDVRLAKDDLGFTLEFDLDKGIAAMAEWLRSEKNRLS